MKTFRNAQKSICKNVLFSDFQKHVPNNTAKSMVIPCFSAVTGEVIYGKESSQVAVSAPVRRCLL